MISTVNSKIVKGHAAINPQILESTNCGEKKIQTVFLDFSYGHDVVIWPVGLL